MRTHLPLGWLEGMESFPRWEKVLIRNSKRYVTKVSKRYDRRLQPHKFTYVLDVHNALESY